MNILKILCLLTALTLYSANGLDARIKLLEFTNHSDLEFKDTFKDGTPYQSVIESDGSILIDQAGAKLETADGKLKIILEDAHQSGYHRPHWKYHVWLKSKTGFPFMVAKKILYAVIFYDGDGEIRLIVDQNKKLHIKAGHDVKDILYPWAAGTIGRGNPYHEIKGVETDSNGVTYFDDRGFIAYSFFNSWSDSD